MPPPTDSFPPHELPIRVQIKDNGKLRKKGVKLQECALMNLMSYDCDVEKDDAGQRMAGGRVFCFEVPRVFRRCAEGLTVETTSWEGPRQIQKENDQEGVLWDKKMGRLVDKAE